MRVCVERRRPSTSAADTKVVCARAQTLERGGLNSPNPAYCLGSAELCSRQPAEFAGGGSVSAEAFSIMALKLKPVRHAPSCPDKAAL